MCNSHKSTCPLFFHPHCAQIRLSPTKPITSVNTEWKHPPPSHTDLLNVSKALLSAILIWLGISLFSLFLCQWSNYSDRSLLCENITRRQAHDIAEGKKQRCIGRQEEKDVVLDSKWFSTHHVSAWLLHLIYTMSRREPLHDCTLSKLYSSLLLWFYAQAHTFFDLLCIHVSFTYKSAYSVPLKR